MMGQDMELIDSTDLSIEETAQKVIRLDRKEVDRLFVFILTR